MSIPDRFWLGLSIGIHASAIVFALYVARWPSQITDLPAHPADQEILVRLIRPDPVSESHPAIPVLYTEHAPAAKQPERDAPPHPQTAKDIPSQDSTTPALPNQYLAQVRHIVDAEKHYPATARNSGIEGQVRVWFLIDRQGRVLAERVQQGSGYGTLDVEAIEALRRIGRFPPMPRNLLPGQAQMQITLLMNFAPV